MLTKIEFISKDKFGAAWSATPRVPNHRGFILKDLAPGNAWRYDALQPFRIFQYFHNLQVLDC